MELIAPRSRTALRKDLVSLLDNLRPRRVLVVTGAGISVASGLPTYRGDEGYWTEGSANYEPEESGYLETFRARPRHIWRRYLYMRGLCRAAEPNVAHLALAKLEAALEDDFCLATQNVDGLHLRAGNSPARTIEAHGSVDYMRALDGPATLLSIPDGLVLSAREEELDDARWEQLRTPSGAQARPHTMFFDEPYDEATYRFESATAAADACDLLVVIGTSGATGLPWALSVRALEADAAIITIDPEDSPFALHARNRGRSGKGLWLRGSASEWVPRLVATLLAVRKRGPKTATASRPAVPRPQPAPIALEPVRPAHAQSRALAELIGARPPRRVLVMTGAGISAASGIPTFRGHAGYWTGGRSPSTRGDFEADPRGSWAFHLHRLGVCKLAAPNPAHLALARLERRLGDDFCLVTQNVDGLHLRAGNTRARTLELHGSLHLMRAIDGAPEPTPIPSWIPVLADGAPLPENIWSALVMPDGARARPHVLWWNESYNEAQYRSESALAAAASCDLLVVIGTSGSAAMPYAIAAQAVLGADATLINIDPADNTYAEHAVARAAEGKGLWLEGSATEWVGELVALLSKARAASTA